VLGGLAARNVISGATFGGSGLVRGVLAVSGAALSVSGRR